MTELQRTRFNTMKEHKECDKSVSAKMLKLYKVTEKVALEMGMKKKEMIDMMTGKKEIYYFF